MKQLGTHNLMGFFPSLCFVCFMRAMYLLRSDELSTEQS